MLYGSLQVRGAPFFEGVSRLRGSERLAVATDLREHRETLIKLGWMEGDDGDSSLFVIIEQRVVNWSRSPRRRKEHNFRHQRE